MKNFLFLCCKHSLWMFFHPFSFAGRDGILTFSCKILGLSVLGFILGIVTNLPIWKWVPDIWRWIGIVYLVLIICVTCTRRAHDVGYGFFEWFFVECFSLFFRFFKKEKWNYLRLFKLGSDQPNKYGPAPQENIQLLKKWNKRETVSYTGSTNPPNIPL